MKQYDYSEYPAPDTDKDILNEKIQKFKPMRIPGGALGGRFLLAFYFFLTIVYFLLIFISTDVFAQLLTNSNSVLKLSALEAYATIVEDFREIFGDRKVTAEIGAGLLISIPGLLYAVRLFRHGGEFLNLAGFMRANAKDRKERKQYKNPKWAVKWVAVASLTILAWLITFFVIVTGLYSADEPLCVRGAFLCVLCPLPALFYNVWNRSAIKYAVAHNSIGDLYEANQKTRVQNLENSVQEILEDADNLDRHFGVKGEPVPKPAEICNPEPRKVSSADKRHPESPRTRKRENSPENPSFQKVGLEKEPESKAAGQPNAGKNGKIAL